jgi:putative transposase
MTKPLSMDIRDRAMARLDAGQTVREVAEALSVAASSVVKWSQRRRVTGSAAPGKIGGHVPRKIRGGAGGLVTRPDGGRGLHPAGPSGRAG